MKITAVLLLAVFVLGCSEKVHEMFSLEDVVFAFCIDNRIFDLFAVNELLYGQGLKIIPPG